MTGPGRVPESSITIFDSSRFIPGHLYLKIHHEFPVESRNATGLDTTVG
jgi:hypothetical protein